MIASTTIVYGDAMAALRKQPDQSVQLCVTSPPYYHLRAYGTDPVVWGGVPECRHRWKPLGRRHKGGKASLDDHARRDRTPLDNARTIVVGERCSKCSAWRGELGQEPTADEYIDHLTMAFSQVWRVLRDDGQLWVNLGDTYAGDSVAELPHKNKLNIPHRFARAMQGLGWILRSDVPWIKYNGMIGSVDDRPIVSHEYFFQFVKSPRYFHDVTATRTIQKTAGERNEGRSGYRDGHPSKANYEKSGFTTRKLNPEGGARKTSAWFAESLDIAIDDVREWLFHLEDIRKNGGLLEDFDGDPIALMVNTKPLKEKHFAAFPETLVEPIVKAATSSDGCCPRCGAPRVRVVNKERVPTRPARDTKTKGDAKAEGNRDPRRHVTRVATAGWEASCQCEPGDPNPCVVLDPFGGSGTVARVATRLGRSSIIIEPGADSVDIARRRLSSVEMPLFKANTRVERIGS